MTIYIVVCPIDCEIALIEPCKSYDEAREIWDKWQEAYPDSAVTIEEFYLGE